MSNANHSAHERADAVVHSRAAVIADSVSDEDRSVDVIASTDDVDGHGTILRQNWRLERFAANPVVLYSHDSRDLPIGTASEVGVVDGKLRAKITFSSEELNPKAEQIWRNVKAKVLRGISVGFMPHTVTFEREDDREFVVLDDNELMEISVCPVPSNPATLSQLRARALEAQPVPETPSPAAPATDPEKPAQPPEERQMSNETNTNPPATPTVARALGLPPGSSESDMFAAATRLRELEMAVIGIAGVQSSSEALGAVRALRAKADRVEKLDAENAQLRADRDKQNFEVQIQRGINENKLTPAEVKFEREKFERKIAEGRGEEAVSELKGYLDVAATRTAPRVQQPAPNGGSSAPLSWNGKSYDELKPIERHQLWQENPELWRLMKNESKAGRAA